MILLGVLVGCSEGWVRVDESEAGMAPWEREWYMKNENNKKKGALLFRTLGYWPCILGSCDGIDLC